MKVTPKSLGLPPERAARGRVITFYSYKGGTGRSMALANVAWMLALNGERVLVIDWDLEAPGLHRYFHPFLKDKELIETQGLLDFVEKQAACAAVAKEKQAARAIARDREKQATRHEPQQSVAWFGSAPTSGFQEIPDAPSFEDLPAGDETAIIDYLVPLVWPNGVQWSQFGPRARIDLLPAGRQGPSYGRTLSRFHWIDFFERLEGRSILQTAREQLRGVYDYILIDSRTGVSDTSGICTVEMPDTLVVCFTLNDQSIIGASGITESILTQVQMRRAANPPANDTDPNRRRFSIFPVPMRVDVTAELVRRQVALQLAQNKFSRFLDDVYQKDLTTYWGSAEMVYYPYYAFEEIPAVFGDTPNVDFSLTTPIKKITAYLTDQTVTSLPPLDSDPARAEQKRKEIVGWFTRAVAPVRDAQAAYDQLDPGRRRMLFKVLQRLIQVDATGQDSVRRCAMEEFPSRWHEEIRTLADPRLLVVSKTEDGAETVALSDPAVLEKWELLRNVIQDNRSFLTWRQSLSVSVHAWLSTGRDRTALWRGKLVQEAQRWKGERFEDFNQGEQDFLTQCVEQAEKEDRVAALREGLESVALDQKRWSITANALKARIQLGRKLVFGLTVAGAILETLAAQVSRGISFSSYAVADVLGYAGAAALALVVVVKAQALGRERVQAWVVARAAAESLKREMFCYRTSSGPYSDRNSSSPNATLFERRDEILGKVGSIQKFAQEPDPKSLVAGEALDANGYIAERIHGPIAYFRARADKYSAAQSSWQNVEYFLAIIGALLGAAVSFTHSHMYGSWVAVITTISGAVGAHVMAERYDQITITYRSTADRLTGILGRWKATSGELSQLVDQVEATLIEENQAWIAGADELMRELVAPGVHGSSTSTMSK
jgi:MinD-like ATPase involved in chromosome partitioning or flagellar assembly